MKQLQRIRVPIAFEARYKLPNSLASRRQMTTIGANVMSYVRRRKLAWLLTGRNMNNHSLAGLSLELESLVLAKPKMLALMSESFAQCLVVKVQKAIKRRRKERTGKVTRKGKMVRKTRRKMIRKGERGGGRRRKKMKKICL